MQGATGAAARVLMPCGTVVAPSPDSGRRATEGAPITRRVRAHFAGAPPVEPGGVSAGDAGFPAADFSAARRAAIAFSTSSW